MMRPVLVNAACLVLLVSVIAIHGWWLKEFVGISYLHWYIRNGGAISLLASFGSLVLANVNDFHPLISASPARYLAAHAFLLSIQMQAVSTAAEAQSRRARHAQESVKAQGLSFRFLVALVADLVELVFAPATTLLLLVVLSAWFVFAVLVHYFVTLAAGSAVRITSVLDTIPIARVTSGELELQRHPASQDLPTGWWNASFSAKPVAFTNAMAAVLLYLVKLLAG